MLLQFWCSILSSRDDSGKQSLWPIPSKIHGSGSPLEALRDMTWTWFHHMQMCVYVRSVNHQGDAHVLHALSLNEYVMKEMDVLSIHWTHPLKRTIARIRWLTPCWPYSLLVNKQFYIDINFGYQVLKLKSTSTVRRPRRPWHRSGPDHARPPGSNLTLPSSVTLYFSSSTRGNIVMCPVFYSQYSKFYTLWISYSYARLPSNPLVHAASKGDLIPKIRDETTECSKCHIEVEIPFLIFRTYRNPAEKWEVAAGCLGVFRDNNQC